MGNICRSPSAEGMFALQLEKSGNERGFRIDSAGTHSYHIGNPPDSRAIEVMNDDYRMDISQLFAPQSGRRRFQRV